MPQEIIDAIEEVGFFQSVPLWMVTFLGSLFITVLSFILIMTVYGRFFPAVYVYGAGSAAVGFLRRRGYQLYGKSLSQKLHRRLHGGGCRSAGLSDFLCLCVQRRTDRRYFPARVTMSWQYVAQTIFNMLILVALIKGAERIAKEMFGL